jgi:hypothetical protein
MGEQYLTIKDIEAKYPQEWVLVDKLKKGRNGFAVGGVVIAHGTEKDAVLVEMDKLPTPRDVAFFYTGPIPDDVTFLL